jgi:uncharacterized membrane protein
MMKSIVLVTAATTTALMAGLFFAWSFSVTNGLAKLSNIEYIRAFQAMNKAILNPLFFICFMGTAILLPLSTFLYYQQHPSPRFWFLLIASTLYLIGVMGVTMAGNVPLNESLDAFNSQAATAQEVASQRQQFEGTWNKLNNIRTVASTLSIVSVIIACILSNDNMSIRTEAELVRMKKASEAVALALKEMRSYAKPGMSTKQLDNFGGQLLMGLGAKSAPNTTYGFPGWNCIRVNNEFCHGIPSDKTILKEGDLVNIDASAELDGL